MAGLDASHYAALARELGARAGWRVGAVHQAGPHRLLLVLEQRGERSDLVLDLDPALPHACLAPHEPAPGAPTALAHALRNLLAGARVEGAHGVPGERALCLMLSLGGLARSVWFEGFGRQANLYALDEGGVVRATVRGEVAATRGASVGSRFVPVPPRAPAPGQDTAGTGTPGIVPGLPPGGAGVSASEAIREQVARTATAAAELALRKDLERWLRASLAKARGAAAALATQAGRAGEVDALRRKGELLRAAFHLLRPGLARVTVPDHASDPPQEVELELDPLASPGEPVAACFREAQRAERAAAEAAARGPQLAARCAQAEAWLGELAATEGLQELERLAAKAGLPRQAPGPRKAAPVALPWRSFRSADGWEILVGRDAAGNDRLTLHHARPGDLFLHVRGASGSHVIVPTPRGKSVPSETLLDAAQLACLHSARAGAPHNEVDVVERRYVRKPRGSPPGLVELLRSRTLRIERDDARRARLRAGPA
ncbi:MAG: NFACT RNA binding domain-containing protein [Planctomycetia bacterium]